MPLRNDNIIDNINVSSSNWRIMFVQVYNQRGRKINFLQAEFTIYY